MPYAGRTRNAGHGREGKQRTVRQSSARIPALVFSPSLDRPRVQRMDPPAPRAVPAQAPPGPEDRPATATTSSTLPVASAPAAINKYNFRFLPVPPNVRYDPAKPVHFGLVLNIMLGCASTFSEPGSLLCLRRVLTGVRQLLRTCIIASRC